MILIKLKFILINLMNIVEMNELSAKNDRLIWNSVKAGSKGRAICSQRLKFTTM